MEDLSKFLEVFETRFYEEFSEEEKKPLFSKDPWGQINFYNIILIYEHLQTIIRNGLSPIEEFSQFTGEHKENFLQDIRKQHIHEEAKLFDSFSFNQEKIPAAIFYSNASMVGSFLVAPENEQDPTNLEVMFGTTKTVPFVSFYDEEYEMNMCRRVESLEAEYIPLSLIHI